MCTVMLVPETLSARMTPAAVARKQVDELIRQEQDAILEYRMTKHAYDHPALIVKKSKLRPDQVAFMERKCRETEEEARKIPEQQEFNFHQNWSRNNAAGK